jgi:hypothetical protein
MKPNPLAIHMANIAPIRRRRPAVTPWLTLEMVCLAITTAGVLGMFLGMVLKRAFG